MSLQLPSNGTSVAALPPAAPPSQVLPPVAQPPGIAQPPAATPTDGHVISASEWRGGREIPYPPNLCPELLGFDFEPSFYMLQTSEFLNLTFEQNLKLDFIVPMLYGTVALSVDEQADESFTSGGQPGCALITFTWPETSITHTHNLSIKFESVVVIDDDDGFQGDGGPVNEDDVQTDTVPFTIIVLNAVDRATAGSTGVPDIPATAEPSDSTVITGSAPVSSGPESSQPKDASFSSTTSSKARIIVPVVVVPVVLLLAGLIAFFLRRRYRAKTAPSKVFKAENPTFRRIETWVPIDDKRVFSADAEHGTAGSSS
ncbi:hypothetical protein EXIGLDRAFT_836155 [Exidia glandulosa HHB12029]|uniref:Uncharacterized protein n=1 Tax=Exidia glandulosa HHB12029 TaxID=1314781 RepID=A0A165I2D2_EXIGL|nr:hypothetical protein EXIGLDRAFT_836155 [Exidia glandulosa HHB12029]